MRNGGDRILEVEWTELVETNYVNYVKPVYRSEEAGRSRIGHQ